MAAPINFIDAKVSVPVTASITLDATHKGKLLVNDTASNFTLTIPAEATVNYPIGSELAFSETNTGRLQLLSTAGVTVKDIDGVTVVFPLEVADRCLIRKTAANTWILETVDLVEQSTIAAFTSTVDFDSALKVYATRTVAAVEAFTVGALGKVPGARVLHRLVADGVNVPTFTGFKRQGNQDYLNFAGAVNTIEFIYDGVDSLCRVTHANPFSGTPFQISVKTDNAGTSGANQFTIPPNASYLYDSFIAWGDGTFERVTGTTLPTHTYPSAGTYTISIWGTFPAIQFANGGDRLKLLEIVQWGSSIEWLSMQSAFFGCSNLTIPTTALDAAQARTGKVQNWNRSFAGTGLTAFPIIDTSGGIDFSFAWNTTAIAAFPLLVFSNGQIFTNAFSQNTAMVTFAPRNFPAATTLGQAWTGNSLLSTFTGLQAPVVATLINAWFNCPALTSWSSGPLPNCQSFQNAWNIDSALTTWSCGASPALTNVSGAWSGTSIATIAANDYDNVSNFATAFSPMTALTSFLIRGIRVSFSLSNCALSAAAINTVFNNLATLPIAGSQTITVTGNPGAATCTQSIATNKGWLVVV